MPKKVIKNILGTTAGPASALDGHRCDVTAPIVTK